MAHPLGYGTAAALGAIQGLTEFLPISSDGHLAIAQYFMDVENGGLALTVLLHVGTLVATFAVLGKDVARIVAATLSGLRTPRAFIGTTEGKEALAIIAATIPTGIVGLLLKDAVEPLRELYDYVLLDCGPSLGLLTLNALTAADSLLVPIQSEYYALEGLSALLETVRLVQQRLNPNLRLEGIVVTMFDSRNRLSHQVFEEIRAHFPTKLYRTIVRRNVRLSEAPSYGKPICLYDPMSTGAQDYMALAKELSGEGVENVGTDEGVG